jgi:hypothetical protein
MEGGTNLRAQFRSKSPHETNMKMPLRSAWLAVAFLSFIAACYSAAPEDGKLLCAADKSCPDGYVCASNNHCYQVGSAIPPDAPTGVMATAGVRSAMVSWSAPAKDGGSAITSFTVTAAPGGKTASTADGSTLTASVTGLDDATAYTFTVVATSALGKSPASAASTAVTTFGLPGPPTGLTATAIAHGAALDWTAPAGNGGTPVTGYLVQASLNGASYTHVSPTITGTHATLNGLSDGGSYTFVVAAVNAVGPGNDSAPSPALVLASVPATPSITAPAQLEVGATAVIATVVANPGETYAWTISGGTLTNPSGAAGENSAGRDTITFDVTATAGAAVTLGCIATSSVGPSAAASFVATVIGAPSQPTITAASLITVGDKGITASVVAHTGMTYNWTLSGNAALKGSDNHGVTASGTNTITYDLAGTAAAGDLVSLSVIEVNPAQAQSVAGTFTQSILAAPGTPVITAPAQVVISETNVPASVVANAGMHYTWALNGANFSSGSSAAGSTTGTGTSARNSILFDVAPGPSSVTISVLEINAAGVASKTAGTLSVPIGALPSLAIGVALSDGASTPTFQSGVKQYATQGVVGLQAQVASIPSATYAWTVVSGGAMLHAGDPGTGSVVTVDVTGTPGLGATGNFVLRCIASIGSQSVQADQTVTLVAAPVAPAISLDAKGASLSLDVGDTGTHHAALPAPVSTSTYAWSASPSSALASIGASGATVPFVLAAAASAGQSVSISAVETNAAGTVGTAGSALVHVLPLLVAPVITASTAAVAPAHSYTASFGAAVSGLTYAWTVTNVLAGTPGSATVCASSGSTCTVNSDGSISFTVDSGLATDTTVKVELGLSVQDASGAKAIATPLDLPVIAAPSVNISFGTSPGGDSFGANITVGKTRGAFLTGVAGATIAWTVSPGTLAGATTSVVTISAGNAAAGSTLSLTATVTNAAATSTSTVPVRVVAVPAAPVISVSTAGTDPSVSPFGARQYTATLTPGSPAGASYLWSVTGGAICAGGLCGIAVVAGQDPSKGTFKYTVNAAVGVTLSFSAIAINAAGDLGPASNVGTQTIVAAPLPQTIAAGFTTPGDATGSTFTAFAPGKVYDLSVSAPRAGFSYSWSVGSATCPSAGCHDLSSAGNGSQIEVTANSTIGATLGAPVSITLYEVNSAGDRAASARALLVDVIAAPAKPVIQVVDHNAKLLTSSSGFLTEQTQAQPFVDAVEGQANPELNQTFQWRAVNSIGGASLLASGQTAAGAIGIDPANAAQATSFIVIQVPAYAASEQAKLNVTAINAAASTASNELDVTIEPAPVAPALTVPWLPADSRATKSITYGAVNAPASFTPALNADGAPMAESCTIDANGTIASQPVAGALAFSVVAAPTALGGTADVNTTLTCTQTNAGGDSASASIVIPLAPPVTVTLTPANGTVGVLPSIAMTATFSFPPDPTSITSSGCSGTLTLTGSDSTCPALTIARDMNNPALFTITPVSRLAYSVTYTLTLQGADSSGAKIVDAQGVALAATTRTAFTVQPIPEVTLSVSAPTALLQSATLAWTNPADPSLDHVHVTAHATDTSGAPDVSADTTSAGQSAITVAGLQPLVTYKLTAKVSETAGNATLSAGVTSAAVTTALTGLAGDFLPAQMISGLGQSFNGTGAASFGVTWDTNNLYFALAQSDGLANALRNNGDALWIGVDADGSCCDTNGESFTPTGGQLASTAKNQIIWPFNADYVLEFKNDNGTLVFNLRSLGSWAPVSGGLTNYNGALAEVVVPGKSFAPPALPNTNPTSLRVAFAFLNTPTGGSGAVIDLAPAAYSSNTADGHTPATDVLGSLASVTNALDFRGAAFTPNKATTSMTSALRVGAPNLVTFNVDGSGASFGSADTVRLQGNFPPLSYTLTDSSYALADDGTRGSLSSVGHYRGVFNFGALLNESLATLELFFKASHNGTSEFSGGGDRVWTLSGATETVGGADPIVWNTAYALTHSFELDVTVKVILVNSTRALIEGDQPEIGEWQYPPYDSSQTLLHGAPLALTGNTGQGAIVFTNHDFVSGGSNCNNAAGQADPQGCPLNFKTVRDTSGNDIRYEDNANGNLPNHTMNDDVLNKRQIAWFWGDSSTF